MLLKQMINPAYVAKRLRAWVWEKRNPGKPWLSQGAIQLIENYLRPSDIGLEYGSGRSTTWLAQRCARLVSVEQDESWFAKVKADLAARNITNTELLHIVPEHPSGELWHHSYEPMPAYVAVADKFADRSLDFVLIDGSYREACITATAPKIKPAGIMVLDNANWHPMAHWRIPPDFQLIHSSFYLETMTAIFLRRS